jgi:hypothetical protein
MVSENIYILRKDLNRTNEGRNNFHAKFYIFQTLLQMYYIYFNNKHILCNLLSSQITSLLLQLRFISLRRRHV